MLNPETYYQTRLHHTHIQLAQTRKKIHLTGTLKLLTVIVALCTLYLFSHTLYILLPVCTAEIAVYLLLLQIHNRLFARKELQEACISVAEKELRLLQFRFEGCDEGNEFLDPEHDFSYDLDLFGPHSLFACINRSATRQGRLRLAEMLQNPLTDIRLIEQRQQAVAELAGLPDLRIEFLARGLTSSEKVSDTQTILDTASLRDVIPPRGVQMVCRFLLPVLSPFLLLGWAVGRLPGFLILYLFIFCLLYATLYRKKISVLQKRLNEGLQSLHTYAPLIRMLEKNRFESLLLQGLGQQLNIEGTPVSERIKKLTRALSNLDQRYNAVGFILLNGLLLWDFRQLTAIGYWLKTNAPHLKEWISALAEFDALCSLAAFRYNHPDYVFPVLSDNDEPVISASRAGHPLIPPASCVRNDVALAQRPSFWVVTGANMAGKSTYLRTIGINHILACIGAPVYAENMKITPCRLFTSLRTTDSLAGHESYFFAELKRLKTVIDRLRSGEKMFIVLDEILKGTNSVDKQKGSLSLLEQLIGLQAAGIIATHDLMLGKLADSYPDTVKNFRFEAEIVRDELSFSYRLQPGIARNMNACFLMKKMGIIPS